MWKHSILDFPNFAIRTRDIIDNKNLDANFLN